jgi:hypothetical protein
MVSACAATRTAALLRKRHQPHLPALLLAHATCPLLPSSSFACNKHQSGPLVAGIGVAAAALIGREAVKQYVRFRAAPAALKAYYKVRARVEVLRGCGAEVVWWVRGRVLGGEAAGQQQRRPPGWRIGPGGAASLARLAHTLVSINHNNRAASSLR